MPNLSFDRLTPADKAEFMDMSRAFYASEAVLAPIPDAYHEKAFDECLRSDAYLVGYMIRLDGRTAGYGLLNRTWSREAGGCVVWLEELSVLPEFRGQGIGRAFFAFVEKTHPAARYRLETEPENERARRLYGRLGYRPLPYLQMVKDSDAAPSD